MDEKSKINSDDSSNKPRKPKKPLKVAQMSIKENNTITPTFSGKKGPRKPRAPVKAKGVATEIEAPITIVEEEVLVTDGNIFKFYSKSADNKPGKGKAGGGETLSGNEDFTELAKIANWRKVLSNFHTNESGLFSGEGYTWASVEHWYHAHKFKKNNHEYYKLFTIESNSEISTDPIKALGAGGRTGYIQTNGKRVKFRKDSIQIDPDFFDNYHQEIMEDGQRLKYNQDALSKQVLMGTKNAKLVHLETRRGKATNLVPFTNTMKIRNELR